MEVYPWEMLQEGQEARIVEVCGDCTDVHRLAELGIRPGGVLRLVRRGEPCLLAIDGRRLSLRLNAGTDIFVTGLSSLAESLNR